MTFRELYEWAMKANLAEPFCYMPVHLAYMYLLGDSPSTYFGYKNSQYEHFLKDNQIDNNLEIWNPSSN